MTKRSGSRKKMRKTYLQFFKRALCERKLPNGNNASDLRVRDFLHTYKSRKAYQDHQSVVFMNTFMYGEGSLDASDVNELARIGEKHHIYPLRSVMKLYRNWNRFKHKLKYRSNKQFGISHVPNGRKLYEMIIRQTAGMSVRRVRALGKREHQKAKKQLLKITRTKTIEKAAKECASGLVKSFESYEAVRKYVKSILTRLMDTCKKAFPRTPKSLREFPPIRVQKLRPGMSMAYYELPVSTCKDPLGSVRDKGRVVIQIEDLKRVNVAELTVLIAHEVFPGHFFQSAVFRTAPFVFANWFVEGWALYAEKVCDTFGPEFIAARLLMRLLRAARCIIDPAIHLDGLTFSGAKARFQKLVPHLSEQVRTAEVLRYAAIPGQACGYLPGACLIEKWSHRFKNPREFHERILANGAGSVEYVQTGLFRSGKSRR